MAASGLVVGAVWESRRTELTVVIVQKTTAALGVRYIVEDLSGRRWCVNYDTLFRSYRFQGFM